MIVDCERCEMRDIACGECVIGVLLGSPQPALATEEGTEAPPGAPIVQLDAPERRALDVLAEQGLVPKLRLMATRTRRTSADAHVSRGVRDAG